MRSRHGILILFVHDHYDTQFHPQPFATSTADIMATDDPFWLQIGNKYPIATSTDHTIKSRTINESLHDKPLNLYDG